MGSKSIIILLMAAGIGLGACSQGNTQQEVSTADNVSRATPTAKAATATPKTAEDVVINGNNTVQTQAVSGQNIEVTGDSNTATFTGHSQEFNLTGSDNVVVLENVKTIEVTGDNNTVTWRGSTPTVTNLGQHNVIERAK
ncbi:DUF3060 domain-containing protein [Hymenobacter fodinae]|uniref:DUF3060 domain-containing protein n=1 Tax=Hymenobacter fodinae TaxID=2510796 RepID=A0A4Z0P3R4_9BACT|nr:DUF3060 domain-containing protein [Hymenobacter fodinae]TGE06304.1 DUF3060 domain-containing protein [Hymenobacter fodinae]